MHNIYFLTKKREITIKSLIGFCIKKKYGIIKCTAVSLLLLRLQHCQRSKPKKSMLIERTSGVHLVGCSVYLSKLYLLYIYETFFARWELCSIGKFPTWARNVNKHTQIEPSIKKEIETDEIQTKKKKEVCR